MMLNSELVVAVRKRERSWMLHRGHHSITSWTTSGSQKATIYLILMKQQDNTYPSPNI